MSKLALPALLSTLALFALTACEEDVTAVRTEKPFTVFGLLSPLYPEQQVYVFPVEPLLHPLPPEPLDARVTSVDLATGETDVWRDSIVEAEGEGVAHLFWAPLRAAYGHAYRLEVERSDGARTDVEVAVPVEADLVAEPTHLNRRGRPVSPVVVNQPVPRLLHVEVVYDVQIGPFDGLRGEITLDAEYARAGRATASGWTVEVDHTSDYSHLRNRIGQGFDPAYGIYVHDVRLALLVASAEWDPPGGRFDPEVIAQPGVMTNVENGYGFIGAGYRRAVTWAPPAELLVHAGFRDRP